MEHGSRRWKSPHDAVKQYLDHGESPVEAQRAQAFLKMAHHNQFFKGDRRSVLTAMPDASKTSPNKDRNHVITESPSS